ncbi:MAG: ABC transporter ATP-binding protein [bacterium]|nr:ABC transporter ATP-binding protein [bacterium]
MSSEAVLRARGVCKGYGRGDTRVEVLRNLDLELSAGEMLAVVGPSGIGKSTLLHVLGLLDRAESGSIEIDGRPVHDASLQDRASIRNAAIGFVFQHHYLLNEFDARDNVSLPMRIAGENRRVSRSRAEELLDRVGLTDRRHHFPDQLSGGEQQRVAFARALMMKPRILLADEPTGNLDHNNAEQVFQLVQELHLKADLTSIIVTHNERIARRCDRIFELASAGEDQKRYVREV